MGLLDKITGKKDAAKAADKEPKKKVSSKKDESVLDMVKEEKVESKPASVAKENTGSAHRVLDRYHLSEKSNIIAANGRYVFKVSNRANKIEVKKAVEAVYDVHVTDVNILNVSGKKRRSGRKVGRTSDWKKAYVTLKAGEKISGLAEGV